MAAEPSDPAEGARTSRSEERNAAARAALTPYEPGERPWPVVASALVAVALAVVTLVLFAARVKVGGAVPGAGTVVVYVALMVALAAGMWMMRYGAVLAFQALLVIGIVGFSLAALRAASIAGLLVCVAAVAVAGTLFWKLVRVLGRIQAARRQPE